MEKLIHGNIYINIFLALFGTAGAVYYGIQGRYASSSILAIIGMGYLAKVFEHYFKKV